MMTVHEVAKLAGVSVRTLRYYDQLGLLPPASASEAGYRLYNGDDLKRLQRILFRLRTQRTLHNTSALFLRS